jgi:hypothetical protein
MDQIITQVFQIQVQTNQDLLHLRYIRRITNQHTSQTLLKK